MKEEEKKPEPLSLPRDDQTMNLLIRQAWKMADRRFSPEPVQLTNFGELK